MAKVTVVKGDTLSAIAKANGTTVAKIAAANPQIADVNKINVGQKITIPAAPVKAATTPAPTSGPLPESFKPIVTPGPNTSGTFIGPIPTGTTRTATGYEPTVTPKAPDTPTWVKAGTVDTINGPVDVDANGKAKDGSIPIAKTPDADNGTKFTKAGTLLRYIAGKTPGSRIPVYADGAGGEFMGEEITNPVNPGSTGFTDTGVVTLAANTFANTVGLLMGELEASQPWVEELRTLTQGFINSGSSVDEAINLALRDAKAQGKASKFVQRFDAIFKLQDRLNAGEAVQVPTIAQYVQSEQALGDVFRAVNLGELATQEVAAKILGEANKSVAEATAIISDVFGAIDNAPEVLKNDLKTYFPGADRTAIAKALLTGKEGALELSKKVKSVEQLSAAKSQGVTIDLATGADLAAGGAEYGTSLGKFGTVKQLERGQQLGKMSGIDFTQKDAIASTFSANAAANDKIRRIEEEEANRFAARSGRLASQNRASGQI